MTRFSKRFLGCWSASSRLLILPLPPLLALATACAGDFDPPSRLQDLRVLALVADPVEAAEGDTVTVRATVFDPGDGAPALAWSFCPLTRGASAAFACVAPSCETPLDPDPADPARVSLDPYRLLGSCLAGLLAQAGSGAALPAGIPSEPPDRIDGVVRLRATADGQEPREAILRVTLHATRPAEVNRNPVVRDVLADGLPPDPAGALPAVPVGGRVQWTVRTDPASLDRYVDAAGQDRVEPAITSAYATGGSFDADRSEGPDAPFEWTADELPAGAAEVRFWFVVRDLRGGQAVAGPYAIPVEAVTAR